MPEERGLYPKMRVRDQLVHFARLHGVDAAGARAAADALARAPRARRGRRPPRPRRSRSATSSAPSSPPRSCTTPSCSSSTSRSPASTRSASTSSARCCASARAAGVPVVFSSHQLELVERLCDAVAIVRDGRRRRLRAGRPSCAPGAAARRWRVEVAGARGRTGSPRVPSVRRRPHRRRRGRRRARPRTPTSRRCSTPPARAGRVRRFAPERADARRALPRGGGA